MTAMTSWGAAKNTLAVCTTGLCTAGVSFVCNRTAHNYFQIQPHIYSPISAGIHAGSFLVSLVFANYLTSLRLFQIQGAGALLDIQFWKCHRWQILTGGKLAVIASWFSFRKASLIDPYHFAIPLGAASCLMLTPFASYFGSWFLFPISVVGALAGCSQKIDIGMDPTYIMKSVKLLSSFFRLNFRA